MAGSGEPAGITSQFQTPFSMIRRTANQRTRTFKAKDRSNLHDFKSPTSKAKQVCNYPSPTADAIFKPPINRAKPISNHISPRSHKIYAMAITDKTASPIRTRLRELKQAIIETNKWSCTNARKNDFRKSPAV
jgi:hypothetical protein